MRAFPLTINDGEKVQWNEGMDLRDYFAAHAPVDFTDLDCVLGIHWDNCSGKELIESLATARYHYADAMMKARAAK